MTAAEMERTDAQVEELERLWAAPAARRRRAVRWADRLPDVLLVGWVAFVAGVLTLEPASNSDAAIPLWADLTLTGFWLTLVAGAGLAWLGPLRSALGASALAGGLGVVLGYACHASAHHLGAWWLVEAGACGALGLLSLLALAANRR